MINTRLIKRQTINELHNCLACFMNACLWCQECFLSSLIDDLLIGKNMYPQPLSDELTAHCMQAIPGGTASIIEVSSYSPSLAEQVKKALPQVKYTCVTADRSVYTQAQAVCDRVELLKVTDIDDAFFAAHRDQQCWVLGEALSQVADPWALLSNVKKNLAPGGCVILCMPNAQHWSLQVKLAAGAFGYQDEGLLHRSHLRWFTRETLLQLLDEAGFEITQGLPHSSVNPLADVFLPLIGQIAKAAELNVEMAMADATPSHYIIRMVPKGESVVSSVPRPVLTNEQFVVEDRAAPKDDRVWAFPVCAFDHLLTGNDRAVFEAVRYRGDIRKVVLTRNKAFDLAGENVLVVPLASREGQDALISAGYIFAKHSAAVNAPYPLDANRHRFINLWHGIPLKRIGIASLDNASRKENLVREHARHHAVIASSRMDQLAMTVAFHPLPMDKIWITGLPRNDVVLCAEQDLAEDFAEQLTRLRSELGGRRLVLFAPTFRNGQGRAYYRFNDQQREALVDCLERHDAVLGIREHMADIAHSYTAALMSRPGPFLSLDRQLFAEIEVIYREAHALITDYSSCFIDFMLTGRPQISFAFDKDQYAGQERGMFYNLEDVFPGVVCEDFSTLLDTLDRVLSGEVTEHPVRYEQKRRMFFEYQDDQNSRRLVDRLLLEARA
ncbi:CDP-glycerol glycerophosphotransferase family protein [Pseudomonas ovata]|uniref:CDP-glycerol glycerophosphotransferase family protein n=1 Tax=Pseudomonas ovata TaxID=1839709 RepID=UPI0012603263|nr:CDP-glycerol glycerophosphotransferase family protein [Pseudomonas ovata]